MDVNTECRTCASKERGAQACAGFHKFAQVCESLRKLAPGLRQACARFAPACASLRACGRLACASLRQLAQAGRKRAQACANLRKLRQTCANLRKLVQACRKLAASLRKLAHASGVSSRKFAAGFRKLAQGLKIGIPQARGAAAARRKPLEPRRNGVGPS